jgi:hypothetical protein
MDDLILYRIRFHSGNETTLFAPLSVEALEEALQGRIWRLEFPATDGWVNLLPLYDRAAHLHLVELLEALKE